MTNIIPIDRAAKPATPSQTAAGATLNGVYHPPVLPWQGHPEDVLFDSDGVGHCGPWYRNPWIIVVLLGLGAGVIAAMLGGK